MSSFDVNKANRQVCDVQILDYATGAEFLNFDTANTTTVGLQSDSVHAMAKGARKITFYNPLEGTMSIEAQVYPYKLFSLFSDGVIDGVKNVDKVVVATTTGEISIMPTTGYTIVTGTVSAYKADGTEIEVTYAENKISGDSIESNATYRITYSEASAYNKSRRIRFNNKKTPKDYKVIMSTLDKDENGILTPFKITAYKATVQRNFELSFSSEGDPATVTVTFDLMEDREGNVLDFEEIDEDVTE